MASILEALVNSQLRPYLNDVEETPEYQELKAQLDAYVEKWIKKVGESKRPYIEKLLAATFEQHEMEHKENYLYGFRLGAMVTIEVFINKEMLMASEEQIGNKPTYGRTRIWPTKRSALEYIACEAAQVTSSKRLDTKEFLKLDKEKENSIAEIAKGLDNGSEESKDLHPDMDDIILDMFSLKENSRFSYGYSLGALMITELFEDCGKIVIADE